MKCTALFFLMLIPVLLPAQQKVMPLFHHSGSMTMANVRADTMFLVTLPDRQLLFNAIDTSGLRSHPQLQALLSPYLRRNNDSTQYFYLYNGSTDALTLDLVKGNRRLWKWCRLRMVR